MSDKRAPVQGYPETIPWEMHLRAYEAYCKKCGPQQALVDLEGRNCRGGFHTEELDEFIPGWREELHGNKAADAVLEAAVQWRLLDLLDAGITLGVMQPDRPQSAIAKDLRLLLSKLRIAIDEYRESQEPKETDDEDSTVPPVTPSGGGESPTEGT